MIDFTNCRTLKKSYGGANGNKLCIEYNSEIYMLKFPSKPTKNTELSYANSCISEYIGCHIYNMLGIPAQETLLGTYKVLKDGECKNKIVVACKDLETNGYQLKDFASIKNTVIDSIMNGYGTELNDILDSIEEQNIIEPNVLMKHFWDMFVVDSLLGNFDRHNGNWGYLYNPNTDEAKLSPIYDCGSCLYPQADKSIIETVLGNTGELHNRIYNFPNSALKEDGKKISYYNYLLNTSDSNCIESLIEIYKKINIDKINNFISGIEVIDDLQKTFYKTMLKERYDRILTPAYERVRELGIEENKDDIDEEIDDIEL